MGGPGGPGDAYTDVRSDYKANEVGGGGGGGLGREGRWHAAAVACACPLPPPPPPVTHAPPTHVCPHPLPPNHTQVAVDYQAGFTGALAGLTEMLAMQGGSS